MSTDNHPCQTSYDAGVALRERLGVTNDDCPQAAINKAKTEARKSEDPEAFMDGFYDSLDRT